MKYVNLIYNDDYNDADIIAVPEEIYDSIQKYAQDFCDWLSIEPLQHEFITSNADGEQVIVCETDGFIYWLNKNVLYNSKNKAYKAKVNTMFNPYYISVEF